MNYYSKDISQCSHFLSKEKRLVKVEWVMNLSQDVSGSCRELMLCDSGETR